jgi:hypothetical protein
MRHVYGQHTNPRCANCGNLGHVRSQCQGF